MLSEVSVHGCMAPLPKVCGEAEHLWWGVCGTAKLITSWWREAKRQEGKGPGTSYTLPGHGPTF
jgi:hypothetical protein